ncbi:phage tail protein [Acinetobacter baumannii]|uniref:phage tail fiber protein n=1 Tax=Acinetobacter baumannii TaxID=470 RepID=UPI000D0BB4C6|nr:phage tail protein [Acinetobacter baumannii]AVO91257.1 phage tail protein [Acinetobacter baumannii]AVO92239.1 phage tail protein [Acinetobacter baumannii]
MTKQVINVGSAANDGSGTPARTAFQYVNANFSELYDFLTGTTNATTLPTALPIAKGGTGATSATSARTALGLGTAATSTAQTSKTDTTQNSLMRNGAFGLGDSLATGTGAYALTESDASDYPPANGFVWSNTTASSTIPAYCCGLTMTRGGGVHAQILAAPSSHEIYYRVRHSNVNSGAYSLYKMWTQKNTTVDGNGFIKAASPIVKLFNDHIELNNDAEKQQITFDKLGVGDYLIQGSLGFAQEGWYIEVPKDANGNTVVAVEYSTLENGDISIKTYKRKFDIELAAIVGDHENPMDIPDGRWIDVRLHEELVLEETLPDDAE